MNTLRGVFPEPPTMPKRNFIKENMVQIRRMQGFVDDTNRKIIKKKNESLLDYNQQNPRTMKLIRNTKKQLEGLTRMSNQEKPKNNPIVSEKIKTLVRTKSTHSCGCECPYYKTAVDTYKDHKLKEIGIQTEEFFNIKELYETGTIKYPSRQTYNSIAHHKSPSRMRYSAESPKHKGDGDNSKRKQDKSPDVRNNVTDVPVDKKHDFVKENAQIMKNASLKSNPPTDPTMAPPTYQKGVVPKYLRERKEELFSQVKTNEGDEKCPEGHVILPENERKETLRMLRQSYAELVTELNQLPVRSDTLKIRNRKIEIENQLKKLDEGIKVFTRPKVYVKIGA